MSTQTRVVQNGELFSWWELTYEQRRKLASQGPFCTMTGNNCLTDTWNLAEPPDCNCGRLLRESIKRGWPNDAK